MNNYYIIFGAVIFIIFIYCLTRKTKVIENYNIVRDYNKVQGVFDPTDLSTQVIRDIGVRYISLENSSKTSPIGVAITTYQDGEVPPIQFSLAPGEVQPLAINPIGGPAQFVWLLDVKTLQPIGRPGIIQTNSNQIVIRHGLNMWFLHYFHMPSFRAS